MVRKKSVASKVRTRREAYKRKAVVKKNVRSWNVLILVIRAVKKFLNIKKGNSISSCLAKDFNRTGQILNESKTSTGCEKDSNGSVDYINVNKNITEDDTVVKQILNKMVSKVCRLESERKRQKNIRKKKKILKTDLRKKSSIVKNDRERQRCKEKYRNNSLFRKEKQEQVRKYSEKNIKMIITFVIQKSIE